VKLARAFKVSALPLCALLAAACAMGDGISYGAAANDDTGGLQCAPFDGLPSNPNATGDAAAVLAYIADLSRGPYKGTIAAQSCDAGNEICANPVPSGNAYAANSYGRLVKTLHDQTGKWVGMINLDYECEKIFSPDQLSQGNKSLIDYWNAGGLVQVTFCPLSPWLNDESDIAGNPGVWTEAFYTSGVDLKLLLDPASPLHAIWMRKLDRIAAALTELRDAGVVVLWRPLQECTGGWFWYGSASHSSDPAPFVDLWRDMYRYFTDVKKLDNLLWVYAPAACGGSSASGRKPVDWIYPGAEYVDIVAGTSYNDGLYVVDYRTYIAMGKPLGMSEYGPTNVTANGSFDDRKYIDTLKSRYPRIAYWVTWANWCSGWSNGASTYVLMAFVSNRYANEMMNDPSVIDRDEIAWEAYR
jgi:mannan endo-1,4-beta-mannosidase